jgi:hypothetical protein
MDLTHSGASLCTTVMWAHTLLWPTCRSASPLRVLRDRESPPNPLPAAPMSRHRHPPLLLEPCVDAIPSCFSRCGTSQSFSPSCKITREAPSFSSPTADVAPPHSTYETCLLHRHAAPARRCTCDLAERLQAISRNLTVKTFSFFHRCRAFGGRTTVATCSCPTGAECPVSALAQRHPIVGWPSRTRPQQAGSHAAF